MKTPIPPTMFACLVASSLMAQPATLAPAPKGAPGQPPAPAPRNEAHIESIVRDATATANEAVRGALKTVQAAVAEAGKGTTRAFEGTAFQFGSGAKSSERSLAVPTTNVDRDSVDSIEVDLSVMARILQKGARSLRDDDRLNPMGFPLDPNVFGSASGARNIYLEGYGAIFLLSVKYPLVGPREKVEPPPQDPQNDEWNREKDNFLNENVEQDVVFSNNRRGKSEPYDEAKVDGLKSALLNALKNASNLHFLTPQEYITVVVQGGDVGSGSGTRVEVRKRKEKGNGETTTVRQSTQKGESTMTIRVKKEDIDAFAAGKLDEDGFRQKATVLTYLRRAEGARSLPLR